MEQQLRPVVTDHFSIISTIDLKPERITPTPKRNYRNTNWNELRDHLADKLAVNPPATEITTQKQFEEALKALTTSITETVEACVPQT